MTDKPKPDLPPGFSVHNLTEKPKDRCFDAMGHNKDEDGHTKEERK